MPVSMPPIPPEQQQQQDQKQKHHSYLHTWACSTLIALVLLVVVCCLVIWFKVHPTRLRYTVENAIIHNFAISSVFNPRRNITEERLRSTFFVNVSTYNPNHQVTLHYESINMTVEYHDQILAFGPVEPFVHGGQMRHWFTSSVTASNVTLLPPAANDLKIKKPSDPIKVDVKMLARASFLVPHWEKDHRKLKIVCLGVMAHFSSSTTYEKTDCYVDF